MDAQRFWGVKSSGLSRTERLTITMDEYSPLLYRVLNITKELRTLFVNLYDNLPFLLVLNQNRHPSKQTPCLKLESIVLYVSDGGTLNIRELTDMARERVLRGVQLQSIAVIGGDRLVPEEAVFKLREHVVRVECHLERVAPVWNSIPNHGNR